MARGDSNDVVSRIKVALPPWFGFITPLLDATLGGMAAVGSWLFGLLQFVQLQTRIATATGLWLDAISADFFGTGGFLRRSGETDPSYSLRIRQEILRPRATRAAITQALTDLTGRAPIVIEPPNPSDTAAYGYSYYGHSGYGSLILPWRVFVTAYRPLGAGIANVAGYGYGYYGASTTSYVNASQNQGPVTDAMIYAAVAKTVAAGITCWMQITNEFQPAIAELDFSSSADSQYIPIL